MKKALLILSFILTSVLCFAQQFQWARSAGWLGQDAAHSVAVDEDGSVYVSGQMGGNGQFDSIFCFGHGAYDVFLAKYNTEGDIQWVNYAGGPNDDFATGVCIDTAGFVYITGYFLDSMFFDTVKLRSADFNDVFIAKYSSAGDLVWAKRAGGRGDDKSYAIAADPYGDIAIAGQFKGTSIFDFSTVSSSGGYDAFLAKYGNNGTCQWVRKGGGNNDDAAKGVGTDFSGNFFITGYIYGNTVFDTVHLNTNPPTSTDVFIAKYRSWGDFIWARKCDSYLGDNPYGIATDENGNSYITGYFQDETTFGAHTIYAHGYNDGFLVKYDPDGNCNWAKAIGGNDLDIGTAVATDAYGYVYVTGFFDSEILFDDTTYLTSGYEVFIAKYWTAGDEVWTQIGGGNGSDFGNAIAVNKAGEVAVAGYYNLYGYFGNNTLPLSDEEDIFVTKLSNNVGIKEQNSNAFNAVYPNPSVGDFFIEADFEKNMPLTFTVSDAQGRVLFSSVNKPQGNKIKIHLNTETANGIYFLEAHNSMQSFSGKIILNR